MCRLQNKKHYHTMLFHNNTTAYNFLEAHQLLRISGAYKKDISSSVALRLSKRMGLFSWGILRDDGDSSKNSK